MSTMRFQTGLGRCGLRHGETGVTAVLMPGSRDLQSAGEQTMEHPAAVRESAKGIVSLLAGERTDLGFVALDMAGLDSFRCEVYEAARLIAPGKTVSYGELARMVGRPDAARAVGVALAANPFPIVVPCHRVLSASGELHGFSAPGGIATKRRMLELESAPGFTQQALFAA